jgi:hypothetical protein
VRAWHFHFSFLVNEKFIYIYTDAMSFNKLKNHLFSGPTTVPLDTPGLNFRVGHGLGRAAHAFCSVIYLKTTF